MPTTTSDDTKKQKRLLQWQRGVIRYFKSQGCAPLAEDFRNCGCSFFVRVCHADISHSPTAIPITCGLRICPDCERRESARKLSRYLPALQALLSPNPDFPSHFLFKLNLTTPYMLSDLNNLSFKEKQRLVKDFFQVYFYPYFEKRGELSKAEIRRGRCDLGRHGIGGLVSSEFGAVGKKLHWHCLVYAPYMPFEDIRAVWKAVTGDECEIVDVSGIKTRKVDKLEDGGDILGAVKEVLKYATKFTSLIPSDVLQLHRVLKGNRRFKSFGVLYATKLPDEEESERLCKECNAELEKLTIGQYLKRSQAHQVPVADAVAETIENGVFVYFTRELEISSGNSPARHHRARDKIAKDD